MDSKSTRLADHDFIGSCECTLAQIVTSSHAHQMNLVNVGEDRMSNNGTLFVSAEEMSTCKDDIELQFIGEIAVPASYS